MPGVLEEQNGTTSNRSSEVSMMQKCYAKIICNLKKNAMNSNKLQLCVLTDKQCPVPYNDGQLDNAHANNEYIINGVELPGMMMTTSARLKRNNRLMLMMKQILMQMQMNFVVAGDNFLQYMTPAPPINNPTEAPTKTPTKTSTTLPTLTLSMTPSVLLSFLAIFQKILSIDNIY
eukprot:14133793-Ditylum_brightwellii.AAC.1